MARTKHTAEKFIDAVLSDRLKVSKWVRLCVQRHVDDLKNGHKRGLLFRPAKGDHAIRFFSCLHHSKGEWAGHIVELAPWQQFELWCLFGWYRADGSRRFRTSYTEIPRKNGKSTKAAGVGLYLFCADHEPGAEVYCMAPETKVLTADFRWRPVGDLLKGERLIAFDEEPSSPRTYRKLRTATITASARIMRDCYKIVFEDGRTIIASFDHKWLGQSSPRADRKLWLRSDQLRPGARIRDLGIPWVENNSKDAGYLAGVFDGEACFNRGYIRNGKHSASHRISFAQRPGIVADKSRDACDLLGFSPSAWRTGHKSGVHYFDISGFYNVSRFLGSIRPIRLLENAASWFEGTTPNRSNKGKSATVMLVKFLGKREVVALGTSTHTLFAEGLYSHNTAATTRPQARIVHSEARRMVESSPILKGRISVFRDNLSMARTASKYEPLSADHGTLDGLNPHAAIIDELHAHKDGGLVEKLRTALGARRQPMLYYITTAGVTGETVGYNEHNYARGVLDKMFDDDSYFAFISTIDEGDDPFSPATWKKANPNYGVSVKPAMLKESAERAERQPGLLNEFLRYHLNVWTSQSRRWLDLNAWDACKPVTGPNELTGERCFVGLDLANTTDIAACAWVFPATGARIKLTILMQFWVPAERIFDRVQRDRVPYDLWVREGLIKATPGNVIDYDIVRADINAMGERFDVAELGYDPWGATQIALQLTGDGFNCVPVRQGYRTLSEPTKFLEGAILSDEVDHQGNAVLRWMASNVEVMTDPAGNIKPAKDRSSEKIDGIVAVISALSRAITQPDGTSVYDTHGVRTL